MPVSTDSAEWKAGELYDRLGTVISDKLLLENSDTAYSLGEIVDWVLQEYPETIPKTLRDEGQNGKLLTLIAASMNRLDRFNRVESRFISDETGPGELYYSKYSGDPFYPGVTLQNDVIPALEEVEEEVTGQEDSIDELEARVSELEARADC